MSDSQHIGALTDRLFRHGDTRAQALARMRTALSETVIEVIQTNIPLHRELMVDAKFVERRHWHPLPRRLAGPAQAVSVLRGGAHRRLPLAAVYLLSVAGLLRAAGRSSQQQH